MHAIVALLATIGVALSVVALPAAALAASPPSEVQTEPAEAIPGGAKLKGKLNPGGLPTTYYFIYARDTCDEGCTPSKTTTSGPLTGDTTQEVPAVEVTGLSGSGGSERYWDILVASNADGTVYGGLVNFTPGAASKPSEVVTEPAEVIPGGAKLKGELNPGGLPTTYYFEYLGDNAVECLGVENCWPQTASKGPISGDSQQQIPSIEVTGLRMGETYRYRLLASNADGTLRSDVATFTVGFSPVITSLEPNHGPTSGGTTVTIHGEPLENARSVHFGAVEGKILHEECDGECEIMPYRTLVVESPPHVAGTVDVTVQTAQGVSVASPGDEFTYGPSGGPSIESESVSHLTPTDATLEATIDTEGQSTSYEFLLSYDPCPECEDFETVRIDLPSGLLLPSFQDQSVSLDLASVGVTLHDSGEYEYSLRAINASGKTEARTQTFRAPPPIVIEPLSTTSPLSAAGQPAGSGGGDQPTGSGGSSSSSTPGVQSDPLVAKTIKLEALTDAQKLSKALRVCDKEPKKQRIGCKRQAEKHYAATNKKKS